MTMPADTKQAYEAKVKAQLDKFNAQIDEMKAKAAQAKADAAIDYHSQIEELCTQRDTVQVKLQEMQKSSEAAWSEMQVGFEKAWTQLQSSFEKATAKFK